MQLLVLFVAQLISSTRVGKAGYTHKIRGCWSCVVGTSLVSNEAVDGTVFRQGTGGCSGAGAAIMARVEPTSFESLAPLGDQQPKRSLLSQMPFCSRGDAELKRMVHAQRLRFCVRVTQPLALISQIQRAGGTLVSQFLDGHPELHSHPSELHIGRPTKYEWPDLDLTASHEEIFENLFERHLRRHPNSGYQKISKAERVRNPDYREEVLPFIFDVGLQKALFLKCCKEFGVNSQRSALSNYVTSYFNAWLDNHHLYNMPKKYWVGFVPRVLCKEANVERIFRDYPDGKIISVVRDPVSWFGSARRHSKEYANVENAIGLWSHSYEMLLRAHDKHPDRMLILEFERLIVDTVGSMRQVADYLGISFHESLLSPTFNGMPIQSDSSFGSKIGIDGSAVNRSMTVDDSAKDWIRSRTNDLYRTLKENARLHQQRSAPSASQMATFQP
jgi:Sulfotransferase family